MQVKGQIYGYLKNNDFRAAKKYWQNVVIGNSWYSPCALVVVGGTNGVVDSVVAMK